MPTTPKAPITPLRFRLGPIRLTPGAVALLATRGVQFRRLIARHARGDWGEMGVEDRAANERAVAEGARVFGAYDVPTPDGAERLWIITEADRSGTTLLLPSEY